MSSPISDSAGAVGAELEDCAGDTVDEALETVGGDFRKEDTPFPP